MFAAFIVSILSQSCWAHTNSPVQHPSKDPYKPSIGIPESPTPLPRVPSPRISSRPSPINKEPTPKPTFTSLEEVLTAWPPTQREPAAPTPSSRTSKLPRLNWNRPQDRMMARQLKYEKNWPFLVQNIPQLAQLPEKWTRPRMAQAMGADLFSVTVVDGVDYAYTESEPSNLINDEMTKFQPVSSPPAASPAASPVGAPTASARKMMNFTEFDRVEQQRRSPTNLSTADTHYFFQFNPFEPRPEWSGGLFSLDQDLDNEFVHSAPEDSRIWGCKFGTDIRSRAHFDTAALHATVLRGRKRWILVPPEECSKLGLITQGDFSRQTVLNWTDPSVISSFESVNAIDVVVEEGDLLYVPPFWVHYVISLGNAWQCTMFDFKSAMMTGSRHIGDCGFPQYSPSTYM